MSEINLTDAEKQLDALLCIDDPKRAIETYLKAFDMTREGYVPFHLFPKQSELVDNYEDGRHNVVLKYRQAGISTVTQGYCAVKCALADENNPETIVIMANKLTTSKKFSRAIKDFIYQLPEWWFPKDDKGNTIRFTTESAQHLILPNGSQIVSVATSDDALRGWTPTMLIMDEAAFIEGGQSTWSASLASVGTGGKIFLISTPNGLDEIYYQAYENAINGISDFTVTEMAWWQDPRYNGSEISSEKLRSGLKMIKTDDIVDWIRKSPVERDEEVIEMSHINLADISPEETEEIKSYIRKGYRPYSAWYDNQCRSMNLNKRKINQELECAFLGSGDNVIDSNAILEQETKNVLDPIRKENKDQTWVWADPVQGHKYILALDVSRGDSDDKTAIVVIDFDTWEQVLEFHGYTRPDRAAELAVEYARRYSAFIVLDLTGMGVASAIELKESNYPAKLCYYEGLKESELFGGPPDEKLPGLNFGKGNVRNQIVTAIEEAFRKGFKIRSKRIIAEAHKFVFINGKADHVKGAHDDLLMSLGMCVHIANTHFNKLIKNNNTHKAMIKSWKVDNNPIQTPVEVDQFKTVTGQNKRVQALMDNSVNKYLNNTRYNTEQYGWVFGVKGMMRKKR